MKHRYAPIDALRGLVIMLMALDHVRAFVSPSGSNPTDLASTTPLFFLVRWVTHLCAPTFVFLMGAVAGLQFLEQPSRTRRFLLSRGFWLIGLEVVWVSFCWDWNPASTILGVLWALGGSMILLAFCAGRTGSAITTSILGMSIVLILEFLNIQPPDGGLRLFFQPGSMDIMGHRVAGSYALMPWFGVALLGFGLGPWLIRARPMKMAWLGFSLLGLFLGFRYWGITDPNPWTLHPSMFLTIADFANPSKYPPSFSYMAMTLGFAVLLLSGPLQMKGRLNGTLMVFGRVSMFVYLVHLPLAHLLGNAYSWLAHGQSRVPSSEPVSISVILLSWLVLAAVLWPLCVRWDRLKQGRKDLPWLRYL